MRWLRFIALIIFVVLTAWAIPVTFNNPIASNIIITLIFVVVTLWIGAGFFKKNPRQRMQN